MKVVLTDGTTFTCGGYKALDSGGVVLTDDPKRKHVIGYVPESSLAYILPDGVEPDEDGVESDESEEGEGGLNEESEDEVNDDELDEGDDGGEESDEANEDGREDNGEQSDDDAAEAVSDEDEDEVAERIVSAGVETAVEGVTTAASDDAVGEHTHEDVVERVEQLESRVDGLDGRVDAMTEQLADIVARGTATEEARTPEDVRNIRGIGEAYATRLRASGIDTVAALSEASDAEIAAAVDISERRASEWRRRAKTVAESEVTDDV